MATDDCRVMISQNSDVRNMICALKSMISQLEKHNGNTPIDGMKIESATRSLVIRVGRGKR